MNLTKREKFLLSILCVVVVMTVYTVFLLLPLYNEYVSNQAELKTQKELHETMEITAARYGTHEQDIKDAKKIAEDKLNLLLPTQENDKLHDYLVSLAESVGVKVKSTNLIDTSIQLVNPEYPEDLNVETDPEAPTTYSIKDALFQVNGIVLPEETLPNVSQVYMENNVVSIDVSGSTEQVSAFLEAIIAQNKTMKTTMFSRDTKSDTYTIVVSVYSTQGVE
ncbi:hypothetical protein [Anaerorhabdus sp.]|uniref:hypothetical protein n=1 Tax=Anaerorhabdus sp. TaxID=1872524 RepID=UPI002FCABF76